MKMPFKFILSTNNPKVTKDNDGQPIIFRFKKHNAIKLVLKSLPPVLFVPIRVLCKGAGGYFNKPITITSKAGLNKLIPVIYGTSILEFEISPLANTNLECELHFGVVEIPLRRTM